MERRSFLKTATAGSFAGALLQSVALADTVEFPQDGQRYFELTLVHTLIPPEGSAGVTRLWAPLPEDEVFQRIRRISFKGNYRDAYITTNNAYGAKTLFAEWPDAKNKPELTVTLEIATLDWEPERNGLLKNYRAPEVIQYPTDVQP